MAKISIESQAIREIEYERKKMNLHIWFQDGDYRIYRRVPLNVAQELVKAPSAGKYFNLNIRDEYNHN